MPHLKRKFLKKGVHIDDDVKINDGGRGMLLQMNSHLFWYKFHVVLSPIEHNYYLHLVTKV
jgi:hypothetical protein